MSMAVFPALSSLLRGTKLILCFPAVFSYQGGLRGVVQLEQLDEVSESLCQPPGGRSFDPLAGFEPCACVV